MAMKHFLTKFFKAANHYPSNQFILLTQGPIPDFFELAILDFFFQKILLDHENQTQITLQN